jgi:D-sedoheptulose 7-phosphate isomerase
LELVPGDKSINRLNFKMSFPDQSFSTVSRYLEAYISEHEKAFKAVDPSRLMAATEILDTAYQQGHTVYVCGNGGSAAIANHMVCDHGKLVQTDTPLRVKVVSLCSSNELMTAISNDISYDEVFAYPLRSMGQNDDVLLTISASGASPNVVKAIEAAKEMGITSIAFTAFSGGQSAELADVNVHVPCDNYGIAEDIHQSLMQIIAQFIRMRHMDSMLVAQRRF